MENNNYQVAIATKPNDINVYSLIKVEGTSNAIYEDNYLDAG